MLYEASPPKANPHFQRFGVLVNRWLSRLSSRELRVLLVFLYHADDAGIAWPTAPSIAEKTRVNERHVKRTIGRLKSKGLLELVEQGGGRNKPSVYRVNLETVADTATVKGDENSGRFGTETVAVLALNSGRFGTETVAKTATRTTKGTTHRTTKGTTQGFADVPAELSTPEFHRAWADWLKHRREKKKPMTPTSSEKLLKKLAGWGPRRAIAAIEHSIVNGWTGCFEEKGREGVKPDPMDPNSPSREMTPEDEMVAYGKVVSKENSHGRKHRNNGQFNENLSL